MDSERQGTSSVAGSLLAAGAAALAATVCCVGPFVILALGAGSVSAAKLQVIEPYRPILLALAIGFLVLAFFKVYRSRGASSCSKYPSCKDRPLQQPGRKALWIVSPAILLILASPYLSGHLHIHLLKCSHAADGPASTGSESCCVVDPDSDVNHQTPSPGEPAQPIEPAREIVFAVDNLQCTAVKGVGCGSMLWPVLNQLDQVKGVSRSFSNWTGTRLRVSVGASSDRGAVANRVRELLTSDDRHPSALTAAQATQALRSEKWYPASQLVDLSSYEFRTIAKRRILAFGQSEKLDAVQREKLLDLVDQLWDKSGDGLKLQGIEPEAYGRYWHARMNQFVAAYAKQARELLTAAQSERLLRQYGPPATRPTEASSSAGH